MSLEQVHGRRCFTGSHPCLGLAIEVQQESSSSTPHLRWAPHSSGSIGYTPRLPFCHSSGWAPRALERGTIFGVFSRSLSQSDAAASAFSSILSTLQHCRLPVEIPAERLRRYALEWCRIHSSTNLAKRLFSAARSPEPGSPVVDEPQRKISRR